MKTSVIVTAYYRRENLRRCLTALARQSALPDQIIIADDSGNAWAKDWAEPPFEYLQVREDGLPRCSNMAVLTAWEHLVGDYVVLCFSDILAPSGAIKALLDRQEGEHRTTCIVYGLDAYTTQHLDNFLWMETDCEILRYLPGFWDWRTISRASNSGAKGWKHHLNFTGNTRKGWEAFGDPLVRKEGQGIDEVGLHKVEMENKRLPHGADFAVYHQWHPSTIVQTKIENQRREFIGRKLKGLEEGEWIYPDGSPT